MRYIGNMRQRVVIQRAAETWKAGVFDVGQDGAGLQVLEFQHVDLQELLPMIARAEEAARFRQRTSSVREGTAQVRR